MIAAQWTIVAILLAVCIYLAIRLIKVRMKNPCESCSIRDCCKSDKKR